MRYYMSSSNIVCEKYDIIHEAGKKKKISKCTRSTIQAHSSSLKVSSLPSFSGLFEDCFFFSADSFSCLGF